ncbi:MAG TPA: DinB family protein [Anaerolineales bacterium]|nr:DinB family protein [Anaerolineales bacterium]
MKELREYRVNLITRLEDAARAFRAACLAVTDPYLPLDENGWNVHQLAVHTRDVDRLVYGLRVRRTALEENPEFPSFDGDAHMAEHYREDEPLSEVLDGLVASMEALVELLRALPDEAWSRVSRHTMLGGGLTLQSWVEKSLAHIEEHLEAVKTHSGS